MPEGIPRDHADGPLTVSRVRLQVVVLDNKADDVQRQPLFATEVLPRHGLLTTWAEVHSAPSIKLLCKVSEGTDVDRYPAQLERQRRAPHDTRIMGSDLTG